MNVKIKLTINVLSFVNKICIRKAISFQVLYLCKQTSVHQIWAIYESELTIIHWNEVDTDKEVNNFTVNRVFLKIYSSAFNLSSNSMTLPMLLSLIHFSVCDTQLVAG